MRWKQFPMGRRVRERPTLMATVALLSLVWLATLSLLHRNVVSHLPLPSQEACRGLRGACISPHDAAVTTVTASAPNATAAGPARLCETVDVIYTWVNGSDPVHVALLNKYKIGGSAANQRAFRDYGVLRFSMRSLQKFAPWVSRIFLLTSGQDPPTWLRRDVPNLKIVTHAEVFENVSHLPTFNSNSIEAHLRRVPGLSECFMYMNDDFFLAREVPLDHFVDEKTGKLKLYMDGFKAPETEALKTNTWHRSVANTNELLTKWYTPQAEQPTKRNYAGHHCYFMRKSILDIAWNRWHAEYMVTSSHRFREPIDVATPFLHANLALEEKLATKERSPNAGGTWSANETANAELWSRIEHRKPYCVCLQDGLDESEKSAKQIVTLERLLCKMFPATSPFERDSNPCDAHKELLSH